MKLLHGKTAVITGATRGIGRAVAEAFAAQGCALIPCLRTPSPEALEALEALGRAQGVPVTPVALDLGDEGSVKAAVRTILGFDGPLDILVNNAGVAAGGLFQMMSAAEMRRVFEVNLFGQLLFTQGLVRKMMKGKAGSIINIASTAAAFADPGTLVYGCSKAALIRATESLATELGAHGIRANALAPGVVRTDMAEQMAPAAREALIRRSALKREAEPADVANAALFLASDLSSFITGQVLRVDGGMV